MLELEKGILRMMSGRRSEGLALVMKKVSSSLSCVLLTI